VATTRRLSTKVAVGILASLTFISGGGHNPAALYLKTATLFGAFRTLEKPFPRTALLAAVRDALA